MAILGFLLVIVGIFSIVEVFTDVNLWFQVTDFWPVLLIIYGLYKIIKRRKVNVSYLIIIVLGVFFQLDKLNLLTPKLSTIIWASTLIVVGIILAIPSSVKNKFKAKQNPNYGQQNYNQQHYSYKGQNPYDNVKYHYKKTNYKDDVNNSKENDKGNNQYNYTKEDFKEKSNEKAYEDVKYSYENVYTAEDTRSYEDSFTEIGSNLIDLSYAFQNKKIKIRSSSFSGGDISSTFGEVTLDLRNVYPASRIIELYCNVYVSNLELLIPYNWNYEVIGSSTDFYEVEDAECTLRIFYKNILGELIITK